MHFSFQKLFSRVSYVLGKKLFIFYLDISIIYIRVCHLLLVKSINSDPLFYISSWPKRSGKTCLWVPLSRCIIYTSISNIITPDVDPYLSPIC